MNVAGIFAQKLSQLRAEKNWSIERMASRCNLSTRYYWGLEQGRHTPGLDTAVDIARAFDLSLDELFLKDESSLNM